MKTVSVVSALCAVAIVVPAVFGQERPRSDRREIAVTGYGFVKYVPDGLEFKIGVESDAGSVEAVRRDNDAKMNALLKALKEAGVPEQDIVTTNFRLTRQFTPAEASQTKKEGLSFKLSRDVRVNLKKISGAENVVAAAMKAGANTLTDFSFTDAKSVEHNNAAVDAAIADAIQLADRQAAKFGAKRGKVSWISDDRPNSLNRARDNVVVTGSLIPNTDLPAPLSNGEVSLDRSIYAQFELE